MGVNKLKEYEINEKTLALVALEDKTKVIEEDEEFIVSKNATEIMEDSCAYFGSTLKGRQQGTEKMIGVSYKAPIIVEESRSIIFFPTNSSRKSNICSWISLENIENYEKIGKEQVKILFKNGTQVIFPMSYGIMDNQVLRAARLESVLRSRKKKKSV